ncbi:MAG: hypothetical protein ACYDAK_11195 [Candidatus Limnocylindrales bacterium]
MDTSHNDLLGELAADAALERADFLVQATEQFRRFLDRHGERIRDIGGLTLIDEDPDYLSIAPDLTFRSRSRYQDGETGEWVSETEVVETAGELIELYNPADLYAAFAEAAREAAGLEAEPTATGDLFETAHVSPTDSISLEDPYAGAADSWAAGQIDSTPPSSEEEAAHRLYDLALAFQDRSQRTEAGLFEQFSEAAEPISAVLGDVTIVDDEDERLTLGRGGTFRGEVIPDDESGEWRTLATADDLVEFYDPTDVFGDLADALAEAFPAIAPDAHDGDADDDADEADDAGADAKDADADTAGKASAADTAAKAGAADASPSGSVDRG